jgi:hypothetical protein
MKNDIKYTLQGKVRLFVKENDKIIKDTGFVKNLILNSGMDEFVNRPITDLFSCCVIGTGSAETKKVSRPNITSYTSGNGYDANLYNTLVYRVGSFVSFSDVSATASIISTNDIGRIIKIENDGNYLISSRTNSLTCSVLNIDSTVPTGSSYNNDYSIQFVEQISMSAELFRIGKSTDVYSFPSSSYGSYYNYSNGTTITNGTVTHTRSFLLNSLPYDIVVREVGFSWSPLPNVNKLFSRIRLTEGPSGSAVNLVAGQNLIVLYELDVGMSPYIATSSSLNLSSSVVSGLTQLESYGISNINSNGLTSYYDGGYHGNEPYFNNQTSVFGLPSSSYGRLFIYTSSDSSSFSSWGTNISRTSNLVTKSIDYISQYTSATYNIKKVATFSDVESINSNLRTIGVGVNTNKNLLSFIIDTPQNKQNGYLLSVSQSFNWSRVFN